MSNVKLRILEAGSCVHPEHVVLQSWRFSPMQFPAMFAVLEHPTHGLCLFDTGYSRHFLEATRSFPERLYAWMTPIELARGHSAAEQLAVLGYPASEVRHVFISHFHADHISGLCDFPRARFRFWPAAYQAVRHLSRVRALSKGMLPALLPKDFLARSQPLTERAVALPNNCHPFREGVDLFGDGSCFAVLLPGHAHGQMGVFVRHTDDRLYFLVADACWTRASYQRNIAPHRITHLLFDDVRRYHQTLAQLGTLHRQQPDVVIVPSHCHETLQTLRASPAFCG